jgi:DNA-binding transcriptional MerR regulator
MNTRIITLFGEEEVPELIKGVGNSRAKKKQEEVATPEDITPPEPEPETTPVPEPVAEKEEQVKSFEFPEDWKGEKKYYSIGEVATLFGVKTSHIRFWTNEFKLNVRTTRKGDRLYTADLVRELKAIHHLVKERGFTLSGAKAKLKVQNKRDVETIDLKQSLLQLRNKLVIIRNQIQQPSHTPSS